MDNIFVRLKFRFRAKKSYEFFLHIDRYHLIFEEKNVLYFLELFQRSIGLFQAMKLYLTNRLGVT